MKIEKFFKWIQNKLLNYPDISISTVKMFVDKFYHYLSKKEREKWKLQYQIVSEFTLKQISLDNFIKETITHDLIEQLNKLKNNDEIENNEMEK